MQQNSFSWPLINDNITSEDKESLIDFISKPGVRFTQHVKVRQFEKEWSNWLGVENSTFVNSGASANWIMASILKEKHGLGEIILSPFGWVSDIVPFLVLGFTPVFVDVDPKTMSADTDSILNAVSDKTKAVLMVHILGFNGLTNKLVDQLREKNIPLIEDCCESHGATFNGQKVGTFGCMSNFSFYFGHHMTTIEGGMVSTNCSDIQDLSKMFRSHGMTREASPELREKYKSDYPELNPLFTFAVPGFNVRSHELCAVIGLSQLNRLDSNIEDRQRNLSRWLKKLDKDLYYTDFATEGSSNFSLPLILKDPDISLFDRVCQLLTDANVEYRLGTAGGGNQSLQPYLESFKGRYRTHGDLDNLNHIHRFGLYIGNHTEVTLDKIDNICKRLNDLRGQI